MAIIYGNIQWGLKFLKIRKYTMGFKVLECRYAPILKKFKDLSVKVA